MAVGDRQKLITGIIATVLSERAQTNISFDWFVNKHTKEHFGKYFTTIDKIFTSLNGDKEASQAKRILTLDCDAYFGGQHNFILEFDEHQHFSSARLKTFEFYPTDLKVNFSIEKWKQLCKTHKEKADKYRKAKTTTDFNFEGGRTAQRAYLDCFRDLLPLLHGLQPIVRINEFDVTDIYTNNKEACNKIEKLLETKIA
ncbi:hypothetical protein [Parasegetibacter sp. NRK P23]|uniref:DUF7255 family protein n=1 Tax=Parasegetibacter sp. NRK P23 TaxID=2942999 RepID=UPI00204456C9|nr:hypothetical protein [Parasegetibacter sp. NRK P23]MCM5530311.1 hypothetical protein [Parasegetibacter sp. NRK P23]